MLDTPYMYLNGICAVSKKILSIILSFVIITTVMVPCQANTATTRKKNVSVNNQEVASNCMGEVYFLNLLQNHLRNFGNCANIIAAKTKMHPAISLGDSISPKMIQPLSAANTDSILNIKDAIIGLIFFCATICKV